jgi:hypothetical protein
LKKDAALALEALDTYVGTEPDYLPLIAAAGVFFLEAHDVAQLYLNNHCLRCKCGQVLVNLVPQH